MGKNKPIRGLFTLDQLYTIRAALTLTMHEKMREYETARSVLDRDYLSAEIKLYQEARDDVDQKINGSEVKS